MGIGRFSTTIGFLFYRVTYTDMKAWGNFVRNCQSSRKKTRKGNGITSQRHTTGHGMSHEQRLRQREQLAQAALSRQLDWKQQLKPVNTSDKLLVKINRIYQDRGIDPPLGLPSCSVTQLENHLRYLKQC